MQRTVVHRDEWTGVLVGCARHRLSWGLFYPRRLEQSPKPIALGCPGPLSLVEQRSQRTSAVHRAIVARSSTRGNLCPYSAVEWVHEGCRLPPCLHRPPGGGRARTRNATPRDPSLG